MAHVLWTWSYDQTSLLGYLNFCRLVLSSCWWLFLAPTRLLENTLGDARYCGNCYAIVSVRDKIQLAAPAVIEDRYRRVVMRVLFLSELLFSAFRYVFGFARNGSYVHSDDYMIRFIRMEWFNYIHFCQSAVNHTYSLIGLNTVFSDVTTCWDSFWWCQFNLQYHIFSQSFDIWADVVSTFSRLLTSSNSFVTDLHSIHIETPYQVITGFHIIEKR